MSKYDKFTESLIENSRLLVSSPVLACTSNTKDSLQDHVKESEIKLQHWINLLTNGELKPCDYKLLVNSQIILGKMRTHTDTNEDRKMAIEIRKKLRDL